MINPTKDDSKKERVGKGGANSDELESYYNLHKVSEREMYPPKWNDLYNIGIRICRNK